MTIFKFKQLPNFLLSLKYYIYTEKLSSDSVQISYGFFYVVDTWCHIRFFWELLIFVSFMNILDFEKVQLQNSSVVGGGVNLLIYKKKKRKHFCLASRLKLISELKKSGCFLLISVLKKKNVHRADFYLDKWQWPSILYHFPFFLCCFFLNFIFVIISPPSLLNNSVTP